MADLLRRIAEQADPVAFRELYEAYGPRVKAYMMRRGADAGTAEDLAQETLLTVWRKAALYADDKGSMRPGSLPLPAICARPAARRCPPGVPEWCLAEPSSEAQPTRRWSSRSGSSGCGCRRVAGRPAGGGVAVVLKASHSEIAERLALPLGTVKSRMRIAYQKVRTALEDIA